MCSTDRLACAAAAFLASIFLWGQEPARRGTEGDKPLWAQSAAVNVFGEHLLNGEVDSLVRYFNDPREFNILRPRLDSLSKSLRGIPHQPCGQSFYYDDEPNTIVANFYDKLARYDIPYKTQAQLLFTFDRNDMTAKALRVEIIPKDQFIEEEQPPAIPPPAPR